MSITTVLTIISILEAGTIALLLREIYSAKHEARSLKPVDVLPITVHHAPAKIKREGGEKWDVIDDMIQYDDDQRAEAYRLAWQHTR